VAASQTMWIKQVAVLQPPFGLAEVRLQPTLNCSCLPAVEETEAEHQLITVLQLLRADLVVV